ncbi:uncharacterized protein LOC127636542 [Xyrauchen texanus]|uniref:uncharacterized protein LOC127636542 n=1 Tax=Xyrauchen texanus TaxID=154827 RepID=UPI002241DFA6|nr:uncharacterized protein LOC127636542 [Xyrauchen texanus]
MSKTHNGVYFVLWIISLVECKIPEVRVNCIFSEDCILPCSFTPNRADVNIQWYQQEALILRLQNAGERLRNGTVWLFHDHISEGNASLLVKHVDIRSKGRYKCVVNNATQTYVIATVEAPIRVISIDTTPSGLIQCSTKDVYPPPMVQWSTEPSLTSAALQPITRMGPNGKGLFYVETVLKQQNNSLEYIYVCNITSKYGTQSWTASLQLKEITDSEGQDLVIPCTAPKNFKFSTLVWTLTEANKTTEILKYDSWTHKTTSFRDHTKLDEENVVKGDGSLTLKKPVGSDHSGIYTCAFSGIKTRHLIQTHVNITYSRHGKDSTAYNLWMLAIVLGLLALLAVTLLIKRCKAKSKRSQENAQADEEMQRINTDKPTEEPQAESKLMTQPLGSSS